MSQSTLKPIYLLADSQPLFWVDDERRFVATIRDQLDSETPRAAYIGASNGDRPEFYSIFEAAMENAAITECRLVPSVPSEDEMEFLLSADIILLSGGDVERGWKIMTENGLSQKVVDCYNSGAILIGVSAGAVQLGRVGWREGDGSHTEMFPTFGLVPYIISAHQEDQNWEGLKMLVTFMGDDACGVGIPSGTAAIYHPDQTLQPVRRPIYEFRLKDSELKSSIIFPGDMDGK